MDKLPLITDYDVHLFHEGRHFRSYHMLGAHPAVMADGTPGTRFAVWAPNAKTVAVVGDFNCWQGGAHAMQKLKDSGIWWTFIPGLTAGDIYKYEIITQTGERMLKADPFAFAAEMRPGTASVIQGREGYCWQDEVWCSRTKTNSIKEPVAIYEVHLGSWKRTEQGAFLSYRELAHELVDYVVDMGFTHIELMPLAEHPLDASWGYQATGYYAPTSRYGTPDELRYFIDYCHQRGIGVIIDWVPGHFCKDDHGLRAFDGTNLFEGDDRQKAENQGWGTLNFDFSRHEVWSFLISNALYWMDFFHIDGLRVDAVANMLYLDYGRENGEWTPNRLGGRENLEAIDFLKKLNEVVHLHYPSCLIIAEESTAWPAVTRPVYLGGLGFDYKWNMGWMNDLLRYMSQDPIHRKWNHRSLTFSLTYAFAENYMLPLSHDEVVHGKKSLLDKMPGDYWQKFANLRAFYAYFMAHPGKKLLFMGGEFGHYAEWQEWKALDWQLLDYEMHHKLQLFSRQLLHRYRQETALWELDCGWQGFTWIDCNDADHSVIAFMRLASDGEIIIVVSNFTPVVHYGYRIGIPQPGDYEEIFNSDNEIFGGSGQGNGAFTAEPIAWHGLKYSLAMTLPPLATIYLKAEKRPVI